MKQKLINVRLAFPDIFEPKDFNSNGNFKFSGTFILDPEEHKDLIKEISANITAVAKEKWGAKAEAHMKLMASTGKLCLRSGDDKPDYDGFEGKMYIAAGSSTRPYIIDGKKNILAASDGKPYAGCFVNGVIELWAQDNKFGKRINAELKGMQFVSDGDAFGSGAPANADDFDELEATTEGVDDLFGS